MDNVIANVITKIGLDHTAVLGDTIKKIALEKCAIIKNCPVIASYNQEIDALSVLQKYNPIIPQKDKLEVISSDISGNTYIYKGQKFKTSLVGEYQIENSLIVIETLETLGLPYNIIYKSLAETYFPARMEVISKKPLVVLDGAHNPDGARQLAKTLKNFNATALIGMMKDKDCDEVLKETLPYCKDAVIVEVENMTRSITAKELDAYGRRSITFKKINDELFYMDFSNGVHEDV
jgi:dihydrofolate synthase/folylpolyglutamate synthase